jgi:hypothetical protein
MSPIESRVLREVSAEVPDDVAVVGYDNTFLPREAMGNDSFGHGTRALTYIFCQLESANQKEYGPCQHQAELSG